MEHLNSVLIVKVKMHISKVGKLLPDHKDRDKFLLIVTQDELDVIKKALLKDKFVTKDFKNAERRKII